ncbi:MULTISPECIES: flavodoxin family protein [unclassified Streptomyces]|uniref:flavodoxin family protein n=1 Tax=unclassified Streptomyces TaxID=2593676 RepID=UPI002256799C|nr:flavodoxin family protein [Streptomyces sp. NBC_00338]MCX5141811.1 flavodoxin family protein [Streptomyces sp. NBC_00338]
MNSTPTIVAINGSEREGNTSDVLRHAATVAAARGARLEVIDLRDMNLRPCGPCGDCNDRVERCGLVDDVTTAVDRMVAADGIIFAAPVHGFGAATLMQMFIERAGVGHLRFERPLGNKVAGVIAVARRYNATGLWSQLAINALLNRMILVGSGFPAIVHALHRGDAQKDTEGLANTTRMVDRMIDMIVLLQEHRELSGRDGLPNREVNERVGLPLNELAHI